MASPSRWRRPVAPSDPSELAELPPHRPGGRWARWGWLGAGLLVGVLATAAVAALLDGDAPATTSAEAFDAGFAAGAEQAAADFAREMAARETAAFARGQASVRDREQIIGLTIQQLLAAQEAGARNARSALRTELEEAFEEGYAQGYADARAQE